MRCVSQWRVALCTQCASAAALVGTGRAHYVSHNRKLFSCSDFVCVSACVCALMERHQRARSQTVVYSCTNRAISDIVHEWSVIANCMELSSKKFVCFNQSGVRLSNPGIKTHQVLIPVFGKACCWIAAGNSPGTTAVSATYIHFDHLSLSWFSKWTFPQQSIACIPRLPNPGSNAACLWTCKWRNFSRSCIIPPDLWLALSVSGVNISQSTLFSETCNFCAFLSKIQAANLLLLYSDSAYALAYGILGRH